jgi:hypothetical protein
MRFGIASRNQTAHSLERNQATLPCFAGRDSIFLHEKEEVEALDYSLTAVDILDNIRKEKRLPIKPQFFDVKNVLPFTDFMATFHTKLRCISS